MKWRKKVEKIKVKINEKTIFELEDLTPEMNEGFKELYTSIANREEWDKEKFVNIANDFFSEKHEDNAAINRFFNKYICPTPIPLLIFIAIYLSRRSIYMEEVLHNDVELERIRNQKYTSY